jgi:hypothetical protein
MVEGKKRKTESVRQDIRAKMGCYVTAGSTKTSGKQMPTGFQHQKRLIRYPESVSVSYGTKPAPRPQQMLPMGVSRSRCMAYQDQMVQKVTIPQNRRQTAAGIDLKR